MKCIHNASAERREEKKIYKQYTKNEVNNRRDRKKEEEEEEEKTIRQHTNRPLVKYIGIRFGCDPIASHWDDVFEN